MPASRDNIDARQRQQAPPMDDFPKMNRQVNTRDKRKVDTRHDAAPPNKQSNNGESGRHELFTIVESEGNTSSSSSDAYSQAAKRGRWEVQKGKKQKKGNVVNNLREVYAQKLDFSGCSCNRDLEVMVDGYCKKRGVIPYDVNTIPVGMSKVVAGCKVTVDAKDYDRVFDTSFWPRGTVTRDWLPKSEYMKDESADNTE